MTESIFSTKASNSLSLSRMRFKHFCRALPFDAVAGSPASGR